MSLRTRAILLLALACLGWGLSFPLIKALLAHQALISGCDGQWVTLQHQAVRYVGAGLLLMLLTRWLGGRFASRGEWAQGAACAAAATIGMFLQSDALRFTDASTDGFLTQGYVVILPVIAAVRQRRWPAATQVVAVLIALLGVGLLSGVRPDQLRLGTGEAMVIGASLFFTLHILAVEAPRWAANDGLQVTWTMLVLMAALVLPVTALTGPGLGRLAACYDAPALWASLAIIILCTCLPYALMTTWQRRVSSSDVGVIYCSEAVFAALLSLFLPAFLARQLGIAYADEVVTWRMLAGGGLILLACVLVQVRQRSAAATAG